jgi:hypothetical protein
LEDLGYTPEHIPGWVAPPPPPLVLGETPVPAGAPRVGGATRVVQTGSQVGNQVGKWSGNQLSGTSGGTSNPPSGTSGGTSNPPSGTSGGTSNPPTGPMEGVEGGLRAPVGSYNRVAWMKREGVYKSSESTTSSSSSQIPAPRGRRLTYPPRYSRRRGPPQARSPR